MTEQEWHVEIGRLEEVFENITLPMEIEIMNHGKVHSVRQYIDVNLIRAKVNPSGVWNIGPLLRLQELEKIVISKATAN